MNDYKIDFAADTITISKSFALAASDPATAAFHTLSKLQAAYPGMKIIRKTHRSPSKPNANKGLTYARMECYINLHENAAELLTTFEAVKAIAAAQKNPYLFTRNWFIKQFPNYGTLPEMNNCKIVSLPVVPVPATAEQDDGAEKGKTLAVAKPLRRAQG